MKPTISRFDQRPSVIVLTVVPCQTVTQDHFQAVSSTTVTHLMSTRITGIFLHLGRANPQDQRRTLASFLEMNGKTIGL